MKKGVSAVIAVVLILMITVGLAAAAYVWFSGVFETITTGAGDVASDTADVISTSFSIAAATRVDVTPPIAQVVIANTGSSNMNISKINVIVDDQLAEKTSNSDTGILETGDVATIEVDTNGVYQGDFCGAQIKVIYGSLNQVTSLPACETPEVCGDNIIQVPNDAGVDEICDGTNMGGETCESQGAGAGTTGLICVDCTSFDIGSCV